MQKSRNDPELQEWLDALANIINDGFESREFLPLSLSYDHRVINGVYAAQFVTQLSTALGDTSLMEKNFK